MVDRIVALRKESVDRNVMSPRAMAQYRVALRKESVDRNIKGVMFEHAKKRSLSARRAWIEIENGIPVATFETVALRKESVDRNDAVQIIVVIVYSRSP